MIKKIDKTLLKIHEDVSADHYDRGIKYNLFQKLWHLRRFREVLKVVRKVKGPVLDVGCHSGTFTNIILSRLKNKNIYGIDVSSRAIAMAKKRLPFGTFKVADAHNLPFKDNFFEEVFCLEVLEHVTSPEQVLGEIRRVLKKGRYAIFLVPIENSLFKFVWFLWTLYYHHWRHAHVQSFSGEMLEEYLKKVGFKIIQVKMFNLNMLKLVVCQK